MAKRKKARRQPVSKKYLNAYAELYAPESTRANKPKHVSDFVQLALTGIQPRGKDER